MCLDANFNNKLMSILIKDTSAHQTYIKYTVIKAILKYNMPGVQNIELDLH